MIHDVTYLLNVTFLGPGVYKAVSKASLVALFNCFWGAMQTQSCFPRHRLVFWEVAWGMAYVSSHPVVASTNVSMWHLLC